MLIQSHDCSEMLTKKYFSYIILVHKVYSSIGVDLQYTKKKIWFLICDVYDNKLYLTF